ncbi:MAG TPA: hypothetical protein VKU88_00315 [Acidimicrobiales bacterium]|nr:hypothetical protein [Acidimicrobiales bacterium]
MGSDGSSATAAYLEHLGDSDVLLLAGPDGGSSPAEARAYLRSRRGGIDDLLVSDRLVAAVFGQGREGDPLMRVSPFLLFAVAVERTVGALASASYVPEWAGVSRRTVLFDAPRLRQFVASPWSRLFLAELLASFSHVASGSVFVATRRGWRRQRFSELDPVRMATLLDVVGEAERPGVLRRLGDIALFLTGVFPDHVARRGFGPVELARLSRSGGLHAGGTAGPHVGGDEDAVVLLEHLGSRWYRAACGALPRPVPQSLAVLGEVAERFGDARRILGLVTERYLFPYRARWFAPGLSDG